LSVCLQCGSEIAGKHYGLICGACWQKKRATTKALESADGGTSATESAPAQMASDGMPYAELMREQEVASTGVDTQKLASVDSTASAVSQPEEKIPMFGGATQAAVARSSVDEMPADEVDKDPYPGKSVEELFEKPGVLLSSQMSSETVIPGQLKKDGGGGDRSEPAMRASPVPALPRTGMRSRPPIDTLDERYLIDVSANFPDEGTAHVVVIESGKALTRIVAKPRVVVSAPADRFIALKRRRRRPRWILKMAILGVGLALAALIVVPLSRLSAFRKIGGTIANALARFVPVISRSNSRAGRHETEPLNQRNREIEGWYRRGNRLVNQKKYRDALAAYQQCLKIDASFAQGHRGLGIVYAAMKKSQQAALHYRTYLKLNPSATDAVEVQQIVEEYERVARSPESAKP